MTPSDHKPASPLWAVLALAFIASLGTGVIVIGIYFLTGFGKVGNYGLGVVLGATYIVAALSAAPLLGALRARMPWVTSRMILGALLIGVAALCFLPIVTDGVRSSAAWVIVVGYGFITGVFWPLVEGYVSGGRRGDALRRATCQFNIWWAGALVVAFVAMAPLIGSGRVNDVLFGLGLAHLLALALLPFIAMEPGRIILEAHEGHPPEYSRLLRVFRIQLPASYMVMGALSPYLPVALASLGVAQGWQTPLAAVWLLSRVTTFALMERSAAWHGKRWVSVAGGAMLLAGFAACLLAPLGAGPVAIGAFVLGLGVFGVGMGMIYTAALYYAMEVGHQEVAAGGMHEALIGAGYLSGPLTGLGVALLVQGGQIETAAFEPAKLAIVSVFCLILAALAWLVSRRP